MKQQQNAQWISDNGRVLIRIDGPKIAQVVCSYCNPEELEELAEACVEAAAALRERSLASTTG